MSSLEDFYQELDARMALSGNEDLSELSSLRGKATHKYSVFPESISDQGLNTKQNTGIHFIIERW